MIWRSSCHCFGGQFSSEEDSSIPFHEFFWIAALVIRPQRPLVSKLVNLFANAKTQSWSRCVFTRNFRKASASSMYLVEYCALCSRLNRCSEKKKKCNVKSIFHVLYICLTYVHTFINRPQSWPQFISDKRLLKDNCRKNRYNF